MLVNKDPYIIKEEISKRLKSKRNFKQFKNSINLRIENFGAISESDMKIGKINVIGGQNSSGKSTASKLLYCFLKYNSNNRQEYAYKFVIDSIRRLSSIMNRTLSSELNEEDRRLLREIYHRLRFKDNDIFYTLEFYEKLKDIAYSNEFTSNKSSMNLIRIFEEFDKIDELINIIEEDGQSLFNLIIEDLFESEFPSKMNGLVQFYGTSSDENFKFVSNFSMNEGFYKKGDLFINDVFYIDSVSLLDLNQVNGLFNTDHVQSLLKAIDSKAQKRDPFANIKNPNIKGLQKKIDSLINGKFEYDKSELKYYDDNGSECFMTNTASGIKQIGIIRLLLKYHRLKEDSFLIIDEPEVNLHPEWQLKFAKILVMLAKNLNIHIYINTHSPMFIEAMSLFSEDEGLLDDINVYLTDKNNDGFRFNKINPKDMGAVYENLSRPYDDLDEIKSNLLFK